MREISANRRRRARPRPPQRVSIKCKRLSLAVLYPDSWIDAGGGDHGTTAAAGHGDVLDGDGMCRRGRRGPTQERAGLADVRRRRGGRGRIRPVPVAPGGHPGCATATRERPWVIYVKAGTYRERLYVQREKRFLALVKEAERTVVTYDLRAFLTGPDGRPISTFRTPDRADRRGRLHGGEPDLRGPRGDRGRQALAVRLDGDRAAFRGCRFVGWQAPILLNRGRHYLEDCFVSGSVDFVFGGATAYLERCRVHARRDGYLTAASTPRRSATASSSAAAASRGSRG